MKERIRRIALFTKSALFTIVIHGVLLAALVVGLWWPFSQNNIERGSVTPIQAQVISAEEIQQQVDIQKKKIEEQQQIAKNLEELKIKQEQEKKKLKELEEKKIQEEKKQEELEKQKKLKKEALRQEEKRKQKEAEDKKIKDEEAAKKKKEKEQREKKEQEKEKKRIEAEKKKQAEQEQKRIEAEKKKKQAEEKKRKETERKIAEDALKKQLEQEQRAQTEIEAATALTALIDRIGAAVENNWARPGSSASGLVVLIQVKVAQTGEVLSANVVKSSGDQFFDRSAELAVRKASPLPFPSDPKYYEFINIFNLKFSPDDF